MVYAMLIYRPPERITLTQLEPKNEVLNVTYEGLSNSQIQNIREIMEDLDPKYLTRNKKFIFTIGKLNDDDTWKGANYNNGEKIEIQYNRDLQDLRITVCHEILHSYISEDSGLKDGHKIVYDLSEKGVCYK